MISVFIAGSYSIGLVDISIVTEVCRRIKERKCISNVYQLRFVADYGSRLLEYQTFLGKNGNLRSRFRSVALLKLRLRKLASTHSNMADWGLGSPNDLFSSILACQSTIRVNFRIMRFSQEFIFMSHFLKRMNKLPEQKSRKKKTQRNIEKAVQSVSRSRSHPVPKKYYGETLPFLEEREWRIVAKERGTDVLPKKLIKNPLDCAPDYYLPYQAGKDLFTVVLPDERTYAAVIQDKLLRKVLFGPGVPPVTLLCLKDIGTF